MGYFDLPDGAKFAHASGQAVGTPIRSAIPPHDLPKLNYDYRIVIAAPRFLRILRGSRWQRFGKIARRSQSGTRLAVGDNESAPGHGTLIRVTLPVRGSEEGA